MSPTIAASSVDPVLLLGVLKRTRHSIIVTDPQQRILWVNAGFTAAMGYTLDEVQAIFRRHGFDAAAVIGRVAAGTPRLLVA